MGKRRTPIADTVTLRKAQSTAGLSSVDAAELVEVHERTWRRWVSGASQCPWATAQWFLAMTGCHPDYVLTRRKE